MNLKVTKDISRFLSVLLALVITLTYTACNDDDVVDNDDFELYYFGMTDIGPSMTGIISQPSYKGVTPSDFAITAVKLNDEPYAGTDFAINSETGAIEINSTKDTPVGLYKISVACMAGKSYREYKDIVTVNMMKPVPDGITVEPASIEVEYSILSDKDSKEELPTAQVKTDGNHVSITKYDIAKSNISAFFEISKTGVISLKRGSDLAPGIHTISLKLTTGATSADEGIFENALTINVTSKPLAVTYTPDNGLIEEASELAPETSFKSQAPVLRGSLEDVSYAIESVSPETDKILIDPTSGVLSVKAGHGFKKEEKYVVSVKVANKFAPEGVVFTDVFTLNVTDYITPVENFNYSAVAEIYEGNSLKLIPNEGLKGDGIQFALQNDLNKQLTIDEKGIITARKGNSIPAGNYTLIATAFNSKNSIEATINLTVKNNPNKFSYIRYGNNLNLDAASHANQFRLTAEKGAKAQEMLSQFTLPAPETDINGAKVQWSVRNGMKCEGIAIDAQTGAVSFADVVWPGWNAEKETGGSNGCGYFFVKATVGKGEEAEYSLEVPVFISYDLVVAGVHVQYTPFVMHVNAQKIGNNTYSAQPVVTGIEDLSTFTLDYRRSFSYFPISGTFTKGDPKNSNFLKALWTTWGEESGRGVNLGARGAISYWENTKNKNTLNAAVGYVDPANNFAMKLNPNKWVLNGEYPDGIFTGQMTFDKTGKDPAGGSQVFPLIIWFDPNI